MWTGLGTSLGEDEEGDLTHALLVSSGSGYREIGLLPDLGCGALLRLFCHRVFPESHKVSRGPVRPAVSHKAVSYGHTNQRSTLSCSRWPRCSTIGPSLCRVVEEVPREAEEGRPRPIPILTRLRRPPATIWCSWRRRWSVWRERERAEEPPRDRSPPCRGDRWVIIFGMRRQGISEWCNEDGIGC